MKIAKNHVAHINYVLTDNKGNLIDTSEGKPPLAYIHGTGSLIAGLEKELEGKEVSDKLDVKIAPEDAYGKRDDSLMSLLAKTQFQDADSLRPGMQFQADGPDGQPVIITVIELRDDKILVDGNHPLAGVELNFKVEVMEVREATEEELSHGHVHGPGGHEH